ncbi:MAG: OsmC family protein [Gammaproteobacteria bacterium]|jgi:putative redox protein|nr:OsmC family protein [Gammaproteobacteria bacterium]MBQ0774944.1 OsmC family protein [Gammaproteobacteria bacterium]|tara:strand:- start:36550 stop:36954 length:405 start_codon:yes stop_codon:yes gene_type:complete
MKVISTSSVTSTDTNYRHDIETSGHALIADEPETAGGLGAGPAPYDYILAGLGACTAITLRMYAQRKEWDIGVLRVDLSLLKNKEGDAKIERTLYSSVELNDEQWSKLLDIASKTPVTKTLMAGSPITTTLGES